MRWLSMCALGLLPFGAHAESVTVSAQDCRTLTQHVPDSDVTYKPGVDVNGNAVAPADFGGGYKNVVPDEITINIGIDLADRLGRAQAKATGQAPTTANRPLLPYTGQGQIGTITVRGNDVFWNGERLESQDEAALAEACRQSRAMAAPPPPKPTPPPKP